MEYEEMREGLRQPYISVAIGSDNNNKNNNWEGLRQVSSGQRKLMRGCAGFMRQIALEGVKIKEVSTRQ